MIGNARSMSPRREKGTDLGRFDDARQHLASSIAANSALPERRPEEVAYSEMILVGQERIGAAIQSQNDSPLF